MRLFPLLKCSATVLASILLVSACDTSGLYNFSGTQLVSVERENSKGDRWTESYQYDTSGRLIEIEQSDGDAVIRIIYEEGKIALLERYPGNLGKALYVDSLFYNAGGQLARIREYGNRVGEGLLLNLHYEFDYYPSGLLQSRSWYNGNNVEPSNTEVYYWQDGNIARIEEFSDGELRYEFLFSYDDKVNYNLGNPLHLAHPRMSWSENNVTVLDWRDYYGNYDALCRPCFWEYSYNLDGMPVSVKTEQGRWASHTKLRYTD